jgi:stage V sporulation protein B
MYGAAILTGAALVIKIIGACFRIPLGNLIGDTGMGYYNLAYPIYTLLVVIATTGIPIAISRLVSEHMADADPGGAHRVFKVALVLMTAIGVLFFCVFFFWAGPITLLMQKSSNMDVLSGAVYAMRALAPALIFVPIMATLRGFFQGLQDMKPTAVSQVIEQLFRVVCGLTLAYFMISMGVEYGAAGGTFGATAGALAGLVCMAVIYSKFRKEIGYRKRREEARALRTAAHTESAWSIIKRIAWIAVPITIGAAVMPLMYNIDLWVVPGRLMHAGFTQAEALSKYGQLTGFAEPLTNLPKVFTQAISISMVPMIVRAFKAKDKELLHYNAELGIRFSVMIGMPCMVGCAILAEPILRLLYPAKIEAAVGAAPALAVYAVSVIFMCVIDPLTSILQGIGKQMIPLVNIAIGGVCKLIVAYTLTGIPVFNIKGAAVGTIVAFAIATVLNYRAVVIYTGARFNLILTFVRPGISAAVMGGVAAAIFFVTSPYAGDRLAAVFAILIAVVVYFLMLFATRSIRIEELKLLPKGEKLYKLARKFVRK